ncbi:MAG: hypothetical protein QHH43_10550 [Candidatus Saccharicenans sp.]|jgi:hypothetical protein|nr:hypothetical protein [Candidatus Saccharicenans sp.]MDH7576180.1 hypothetical protein [Candidatus Saccharicenans sp.]
MKKSLLLVLSLSILLKFVLGFQENQVSEVNIPSGWKLKTFDLSKSGHIAVFYVPDLPQEAISPESRTYLQLLSLKGKLLFDRMLEPGGWFFGFLPGDKILLLEGTQYCLLDLQGKVQARFADPYLGNRDIIIDLFGNELALSPGSGITSMPVSVIDLNTGREKFRFGPFTVPEGRFRINPGFCFLPVGQDDLYLQGFGNTLLLCRYKDDQKIWQISEIGGNIQKAEFLNNDLIIVSYYDLEVPRKEKSKYGLVLIDWKTGRIIFRKEGFRVGNRYDNWFRIIHLFKAFLDEDGNLCFISSGKVYKLPKIAENQWDANRMKAYIVQFKGKTGKLEGKGLINEDKQISDGAQKRPEIIRNGYWAEVDGNLVRIKRIVLVE